MLTRYNFCGHIGMTVESKKAKTKSFIRVAEIRSQIIEDSPKSCPDCKKGEN